MTHDISKLKNVKNVKDTFDIVTAKQSLIDGIIDGTVLDLHSAVEATGAKNGGQVESIYKKLKAESDMLSGVADVSAAEGKLITAIIKDVDVAAIHFSGEKIKDMKVEVYGSVTEWKAAMVSTSVLNDIPIEDSEKEI